MFGHEASPHGVRWPLESLLQVGAMSLTGVAKETLGILEVGAYVAPSGRTVSIGQEVAASVAATELLTPDALAALPPLPIGAGPRVEVTDETTQQGARRLVRDESLADTVLLNFASARKPGGGFLTGAKAQEEDLTRCSALYPSLLSQPGYYDLNRAQDSVLYTDCMIYSPRVPFFRVSGRDVPMEQPFLVSVITAPAPNAGQALARDRAAGPQIREVLFRRAALVLSLAAARGHRTLLLGAWGCGVFQNDPAEVAEAFDAVLSRTSAFDRVVFAIPKGTLPNHDVFVARLTRTP